MDAFEIRSMLDCACGDATWMVPFFVTRHPEIEYTGVDVVSEVIERNQQRHPLLRFLAQARFQEKSNRNQREIKEKRIEMKEVRREMNMK